jgi:hypothetical protein
MSVKSNEVARNIISAESLARAELDYIKSIKSTDARYNGTWVPSSWAYTVAKSPLPNTPPTWESGHTGLPDGYDGYSVTCSAIPLPATADTTYNAGIQDITVIVYLNGIEAFRIGTNRTKE